MKTGTQTSAGGAVYRGQGESLEFALISVGDPRRWQLPKGLVDAGENPEQTAVREVREEAGVDARVLEKLDTAEYWYQSKRGTSAVRYHKFVHFYLMEYTGGDVTRHDREVHEARWFPAADAVGRLAFRSEKKVLETALGILGQEGRGDGAQG